MRQSLLDIDPPLWTKRETFVHQVYRERIRIGEKGVERLLLPEWEGSDVFA
jgi:hypothetical protein